MSEPIEALDQYLPGHVLVVDDEPANRELLSDLLQARGHRVTQATDGTDALQKAATSLPDVVLLDIMMPGMDGFEVCRQLKADPRTAPIPVLIVTAMAERSDRIKGVAAGADDFLTKPIDREELVLRVRNALYRKHLYDELANKYAELKAMAELRNSLTNMINAETDALSVLMRDRLQPDRPAEGKPDRAHANEGSKHGTH